MDIGTLIGEALNPRTNAEKFQRATCGCATEHPTLEEWETVHGAVELHVSHRTTVLGDEGREIVVTPDLCTCPMSLRDAKQHSLACPLSLETDSPSPGDPRSFPPAKGPRSLPVPSTHPQRRSAVTGHLRDRPSDRPVADPCRR